MTLSQFDAGAAMAALQLSQMLLRVLVEKGILTRQQAESELLNLVRPNEDDPGNAIANRMFEQMAGAYSASSKSIH